MKDSLAYLKYYCCSVIVPMDLDVKMKAVMLGACFLIVSVIKTIIHIGIYSTLLFISFLKQDFMFFEQKQNKNNRR